MGSEYLLAAFVGSQLAYTSSLALGSYLRSLPVNWVDISGADALRADEGPLLVVVPTDADVEQMVTDARFFHGALTGATDVDTRAAVRALPSQEVDPYRGLAPHLQIASVRAASRRSRIITAHLT